MLRETQLRAFYSTTEEISVLFAKQQEQLKAMQRTLEDEENYENTSLDIDLNVLIENMGDTLVREKELNAYSGAKSCSATAQRFDGNQAISGDEASVTEKHESNIRSKVGEENTQEEEITSANRHANGGFGSDIDGIDTAPVLEAEAIGTEQVLETESSGLDGDRNIYMNKCCSLVGETMQLDDEVHVHEIDERIQTTSLDALRNSQSNNPPENQKAIEDTEPGDTIRTADLLASEVVGSWTYSTAPSVHSENESPGNRAHDEKGGAGFHDSSGQVAESQSAPSSQAAAARRNLECRALSEMIGIVAPDLMNHFGAMDDDCDGEREKQGSAANSDTKGCADSDNEYGEYPEDK